MGYIISSEITTKLDNCFQEVGHQTVKDSDPHEMEMHEVALWLSQITVWRVSSPWCRRGIPSRLLEFVRGSVRVETAAQRELWES